MKRKEFFIANLLLLVVIVLAGMSTVRLSANEGLTDIIAGYFSRKSPAVKAETTDNSRKACSPEPPLKLQPAMTDPHVRMLEGYQQLCESLATRQLMIFTNFPKDTMAARADAAAMAGRLKQLQGVGITPIVIAEPYVGDSAMSYKDYLRGNYDSAVRTYFMELKAAGVTDQMLGLWVPFPETNTPNWNNSGTQPEDFAHCVNKYMTALKAQFPNAKGSVLLNATTYDPEDKEWANGDYISLVPYLKDLDKKLITSIGIQGFPWVSDATRPRKEIFKATEFLQPDLAIEAARELRTRDIWFNTGTFAAKYTLDKQKTTVINANERKAILQDILVTAQYVQNFQQNEYRVSVNLFSQNKSQTREATDWSYSQDEDTRQVFREFMAKANEQKIPVSLFDRAQ